MKLTESAFLVGGSAYGLSAPGDCNTYLIDCGGDLALVDAGGGSGVKMILENIKLDGFDSKRLKVAFLTHCHFDHIGGAAEMKQLTRCKLLAHEADADSISSLGDNVLMEMAKGRGLSFKAPKLDEILRDGDCITVGEVDIHVLHTPGHTPGCMSLSVTEKDGKKGIFTGDIASTTGRLGFINGPGFELTKWKASIKRLIQEKPDRIYPGHNTFMLRNATDDLMLTDQKMNAPWTTIVTSVG